VYVHGSNRKKLSVGRSVKKTASRKPASVGSGLAYNANPDLGQLQETDTRACAKADGHFTTLIQFRL